MQFVPLAYVGDSQPLPHEKYLSAHGVFNPTVDWDEILELERLGVRIESHGISHKPLAELEIDEAAREIAISKLKLEQRLGRPVRAFSYVKGSEADYKPVHPSLVRQAGYDLAFTAVSGANTPSSDPLQLRRYNVEPYSAAHVRARARRCVRPDRREGHRDGDACAAALQRGSRHVLPVIVEAAQRDDFLALMQETYGASMSPQEFDWWFDGNPAGPRILTEARDEDGTGWVCSRCPSRA